MSDDGPAHAGLPPDLVDWVRAATGAPDPGALHIERRTGGASREGYSVDVRGSDGTDRALWLRVDFGAGPQSDTLYSLRREAAVYRALGPTSVRVAEFVAEHPDGVAFLLERVEAESRYSGVTDRARQVAIASSFMEQMARLHAVDAASLDLPELGRPTRIGDHVHAEIDEWETQLRAHDEPDPLLTLAITWLRANVPPDGTWPVVLVQGDTGPGNFMFHGDEVAAVTDWELAHFGDLHDDLGWICVRDTQEPFPDLAERLREYERFAGREIDPERLRYFRVLAQTRCAIGTRRGLLSRDHRAEMAAHLIFNTLHTRLLAESLCAAVGVEAVPTPALDPRESEASWAFAVALDDLRSHIVPALGDGFAARRAKGLARLLKYLQEVERLGPAADRAERRDLEGLLGHEVAELGAAREELCARIEAGDVAVGPALSYCRARADRSTQIARSAMGALADRHHAPTD